MKTFDLQNLPAKEWIKGFSGRVVHGEKTTIIFWEAKAGAILPSHAHLHEQITFVIKGRLSLKIEDQEMILSDGQGIVISPELAHSGVAQTDVQIIDVFSPPRDDYK